MRVFVTGTGRCGTVTFAKACRHISNYTAGHETKTGAVTDLRYPDRHIEVAPHLVWVMPQLLDKYPNAFWVHLRRDATACITSLSKRQSLFKFAAFAHGFKLKPDANKPVILRQLAALHYHNVNGAIEAFLEARRCPEFCMTIHIEGAAKLWPTFCKSIAAQDARAKALQTLKHKHNTSRR
jgi:hypothetical protein